MGQEKESEWAQSRGQGDSQGLFSEYVKNYGFFLYGVYLLPVSHLYKADLTV